MSESRWRIVALFGVTIFLSAFLLFQVQPLLSKSILPWFGGAPSVWTTCMLFFQALLFAGYAYAHLIAKRLSPARQMWLHGALILLAVLTLPVTPNPDWKPTGDDDPTLRILLLLSASVGLPFFLLSSTGPLLQSWFSRTHPGAAVYRLYALSNVGSLLALLSYPFLFDPAFDSVAQSLIWSWGFGSFGVLCIACSFWTSRRVAGGDRPPESAEVDEKPSESTPVTRGTYALWFLLPMTASALLLAMTNHVCQDVASIPFLWVVPLSLYLLTFIISFDREGWYRRTWCVVLSVASVGSVLTLWVMQVSLVMEITLYFSALFFCAMICHGELVRLKPSSARLTEFYLVVSAGGAVGGLLVGVVAPLIFPTYLELYVSLAAVCVLTLTVYYRDPLSPLHRGRPRWAWGALLLGFLGGGIILGNKVSGLLEGSVEFSRSFYGVLQVSESDTGDPHKDYRVLRHGRIMHGLQFTADHKRRIPTTYYGRKAAPGRVLTMYKPGTPKHVGIVGLGVGTLAAYAKPGDRYRIYEINADVVEMAKRHFTYLRDCRGEHTIVIGDARLSMEREAPQQFDVLVLDAFSGDAVPIHLLTEEAFEIYRKHLKPNGVLLVHISNLYFELSPVVTGAADHFGYQSTQFGSESDEYEGTSPCDWMIVTRDFAAIGLKTLKLEGQPSDGEPLLWTDQRNSLFEVYR